MFLESTTQQSGICQRLLALISICSSRGDFSNLFTAFVTLVQGNSQEPVIVLHLSQDSSNFICVQVYYLTKSGTFLEDKIYTYHLSPIINRTCILPQTPSQLVLFEAKLRKITGGKRIADISLPNISILLLFQEVLHR